MPVDPFHDFAPFSISRLPRLIFGEGSIGRLPGLVAEFGNKALLVTGARALQQTPQWEALAAELERAGIVWENCTVSGEPSPQYVDEQARRFRDQGVDVVVGIGGGSVLDAAKAIAGLLRVEHSVMDYLEGVGPELAYEGPAVPFIAAPTTAGTGSEATKNAVLSVQAKDGFKKSFRDEQLVAQYAVVDPDLLASCPAGLIASNGMDALTQLMESYVSLKANEFTDALCISGLRAARDGLLPWYDDPQAAAEARRRMAYAALISGITLAQCGLGSVHGLASPMGAFHPIPHGVVCGTLVAEATRVNIEAMREREPDNRALARYARLAEILCQRRFGDRESAWSGLLDLLFDWSERMQLPRLEGYGVGESDIEHIVANSRGSSMKTNPIVLSDDEIGRIVRERL